MSFDPTTYGKQEDKFDPATYGAVKKPPLPTDQKPSNIPEFLRNPNLGQKIGFAALGMPVLAQGAASQEDSKIETLVRDVVGIGADIALSEGIPIPVIGDTLGSIVRQYISNPEGIEKGQVAGDVAVGFLPSGKIFQLAGKGLKGAAAETAWGVASGAGGITAETLLDENRLPTAGELFTVGGINAATRGLPNLYKAYKGNEAKLAELDKNAQLSAKQKVDEIVAKEQANATPVSAEEFVSEVHSTLSPVDAPKQTFASLIKLTDDEAKYTAPSNVSKNDVSLEHSLPSTQPEPILRGQPLGPTVEINKAEINRMVQAYGEELRTKQIDPTTLWQMVGSAKKSGHWGNGDAIVSRQMAKPSVLSPDEFISLINHKGQIEDTLDSLEQSFASLTDPTDIQRTLSDIQINERKLSDVVTAASLSGSMASKSLNAMRVALERRLYDPTRIVTRMEKASGEPISDTVRKDVYTKAARLKKLQQDVEALSEKEKQDILALLTEETQDFINKRKKSNKRNPVLRQNIQERRDQAIKDLGDMGIELNSATRALLVKTPKQAKAVMSLAETYIDEGVENVKDLVARMTTDYSKLNEQDILNAVGKRIKEERNIKISEEQIKLRQFSQISSAQAKINEVLDRFEKLPEAKKQHLAESEDLIKVREQLQIVKKSLLDVSSDDGKYKTLSKQIASIEDQLRGQHRNLLDAPAKEIKKSPRIIKAEEDLSLLKRELKDQDDLYDLEAEIREVGRFLGKMDSNYLSAKTKALARHSLKVKKTLAKKSKEKSVAVLRKENFDRHQALANKLDDMEAQISGGFRFIPPEEQTRVIDEIEQNLRRQVQEASTVLRKDDYISELNRMLNEGEGFQKKPQAPVSERIQGYNNVIKELKKRINNRPLSEAELKALEEKRLSQLQAKVDNLESQYTNHWREWKQKNPKQPNTVDVQALTEQMRDLQAKIRVQDNMFEIEDKVRRLKAGEELPDPTKQIRQESKELRAMRGEQQKMETDLSKLVHETEMRAIENAVGDLIKGDWSSFKKKWKFIPADNKLRYAVQIGSLPRTALATMDMSGYLRQGLISLNSMAYNPKRWKELSNIVGRSFYATFSQKEFDRIIGDDIKANPYYQDAVKFGLHFSDISSSIAQREEEFYSSLLERIPLLSKLTGPISRGSNRNMAAIVNMLRMAEMQDFLVKHPDSSLEAKKAMAAYINAATGRGSAGDLDHGLWQLSQVFFSPRFTISRYQVLANAMGFSKHPEVRKKALADMSKLAATQVGILSLAKLAGADVGLDPSEPDFLKVTIQGPYQDKHLAFLGGEHTPLRQAAYAGSMLTNQLGLTNVRDSLQPTSLFLNSLNYKWNPNITIAQSLITGKDWRGEEQSVGETLLRGFTPISMQEFHDALKEDGFQSDDLLTPLVLLGIDVQSY